MNAETTDTATVWAEDQELVTVRVTDEVAAGRAVSRLEAMGVPRDRIEVLSALPIPEEVLGGAMRATRIPLFTLVGALAGLVLGVFFSLGTVWLYPLEVGGQENIAPPVLIIIYELTMLGIVVATVFGFVWETWIRAPARPHWRDVSRAGLYVSVVTPPDLMGSRIRSALEEAGAEPVLPEEMLPAGRAVKA